MRPPRRPRLLPVAALALAAALLVPAAAAAQDGSSVSVSYLGRQQTTGWPIFAYTVSFSECTVDGFCGWYAYAVERRVDAPCDPAPERFAWVGDYHEDPGTFTGSDYHATDAETFKLCVAVNGGEARRVVGEYVFDGRTDTPPDSPECADGVDNDADRTVDADQDLGCSAYHDASERLTFTPRLSVGAAKVEIRRTLRRRFGRAFTRADHRRIGRCARRSDTRVTCRRVSWVRGNLAFSGRAGVRNRRRGEEVLSIVTYRIARLDRQCAATGGLHCRTVLTQL